ncbi:transcription cofactor vestigial-like protein 2 isoform X3 [Aquila chrysaetos chrysaetos]|uniref:transcription cofactor vestigial-like protein 2 isoform X3 n=1 Tax=Aquila chrysaetos chrysaetos TaxID=223781 RepID=UPI0011765928|nr:transcription cofactor vestigial-like protein 2 isoform X3 [Aquila chrysaetos chrysaetos]
MSCLDVMYQVYGPPQPYFAAAYSPYHQKLAFYSKMQEAPESGSSASASSSFSSHPAASIKEEDCSPEKERPPEAEYINSRCVLFTYFQGDISAVVDEHFSRALSQPSSFSLGSAKAARNAGSWRDGSFPMSQRSFPPSFWNSTYQPSSVPATLSSPLAAAAHSELPFAAAAAADPYAPASLHSHLHQGGPEPWHHAHHHHHHHHHHPYIGTQSTAYPRPAAMHEVYGPHFDPRYGSLLVPTASVRPHRLTPASVPTPVSPPCELGKSEAGAAAAWTTPGPFPNAAGEMSLGLNVDTGKELPAVLSSSFFFSSLRSQVCSLRIKARIYTGFRAVLHSSSPGSPL